MKIVPIAQSTFIKIDNEMLISEALKLNFKLINQSHKGFTLQDLDSKNVDVPSTIRVFNPNDGKTALRLYGGALRLVCLNGLIVGSQDSLYHRVIHRGQRAIDYVHEFIESLVVIRSQLDNKISADISLMNKIASEDQIKVLTLSIARKRGLKVHTMNNLELDKLVADLNIVRRIEDQENTVFNVLNRVQENLLRPLKIDDKLIIKGLKVLKNEVRLDKFNQDIWTVAMGVAA